MSLTLPFPSSQDYADHSFAEEIDQICETFPNDKNNNIEMDQDYVTEEFGVFNSSQYSEGSQKIIWDDKMLFTFNDDILKPVTPAEISPQQIQEDTLNTPQVRVTPFSFTTPQTQSQTIAPANAADYFAQYSPVSVDENDNNTNDEIKDDEQKILEKFTATSQQDLNVVKKEEECLQQTNINHNQTQTAATYVVMDTNTTSSPVLRRSGRQRVPSLKLKISKPIEQPAQGVSTPQITNDILDMEGEKFDLISYVDSANQPVSLKSN